MLWPLFLLAALAVDASLDACRQSFGSRKYDLNRLSGITLAGTDAQFRYLLRPCGLVATEKCGKSFVPFEPGMMACQERISTSSFESAMGFLDGYDKSPNLAFIENPQGPGTGIVMIIRNAKCNGQERPVNVTFVCDKTVASPTTMNVVEGPTCKFAIEVRATQACPTSGRTAGGTWFVVTLVILVVVYLLVGVSYNRFVKKETGLAVLPHPQFWLLLYGLFIIGCRFCFSSVRNCFRGTPTLSGKDYQSV